MRGKAAHTFFKSPLSEQLRCSTSQKPQSLSWRQESNHIVLHLFEPLIRQNHFSLDTKPTSFQKARGMRWGHASWPTFLVKSLLIRRLSSMMQAMSRASPGATKSLRVDAPGFPWVFWNPSYLAKASISEHCALKAFQAKQKARANWQILYIALYVLALCTVATRIGQKEWGKEKIGGNIRKQKREQSKKKNRKQTDWWVKLLQAPSQAHVNVSSLPRTPRRTKRVIENLSLKLFSEKKKKKKKRKEWRIKKKSTWLPRI